MKDPAEVLQQIYAAGFDLQPMERYPRAIAVIRGDWVVLLEPGSDGSLRLQGAAGWRFPEGIGVLTTLKGKPVFQWKDRVVDATGKRQQELRDMTAQVADLLKH